MDLDKLGCTLSIQVRLLIGSWLPPKLSVHNHNNSKRALKSHPLIVLCFHQNRKLCINDDMKRAMTLMTPVTLHGLKLTIRKSVLPLQPKHPHCPQLSKLLLIHHRRMFYLRFLFFLSHNQSTLEEGNQLLLRGQYVSPMMMCRKR